MWGEALALLDQAERKHRHFIGLIATPAARPVWEPPADMFADGNEINVVVALPGARAEAHTVTLTPSGVVVDAEATPPAAGTRMSMVRLEIPYGRMRRRIDLPPGRYALTERLLDHGCLHLRLTKEGL